jgi:hypothetical protein
MNRILLLILIAGLTFLVVLFALRPDLLDTVWLWLVGLSGAIVKGFHLLIEFFKDKFSSDKENNESSERSDESTVSRNRDEFTGITLKLLRYSSDEATTTGMLYLGNTHYCLTLEPRASKKRIPAGIYETQFLKENTNLTLKYKEKYPEWFTRHLQLKDVPGLKEVVIHNAGDNSGTNGPVVFNSLNIGNKTSFLSNSTETYRRLYEFLSNNLDRNIPVRIIIYDEKWIEKLN